MPTGISPALFGIAAVCLMIMYIITVVAVRPTAAGGMAQVLRALAEPLRAVLPWNASRRCDHKTESSAGTQLTPSDVGSHELLDDALHSSDALSFSAEGQSRLGIEEPEASHQ